MVRCALPCLVLALSLAACGGGTKLSVGKPEIKACQTTMPEAAPWDGKPAAPGSVIIIEPAPGGQASPTHDQVPLLVAYVVDPKARIVRRQIVDRADVIYGLAQAVITDPRENAGTLAVLRPPPPPPDPPIHLGGLVDLAVRANPPGRMEPCQVPSDVGVR